MLRPLLRFAAALLLTCAFYSLSYAHGFLPPVNYATGNEPEWIVAGDFNGDGNQDFAVVNHKDNNVRIYLGEGDGTFLSNQILNVDASPAFIAVGDFNGDGRPDLATTNGGTISVLLNSTAGFFPAVTYSNGGSVLVATDFDADGHVDLVSVTVSGVVTFLKGDGKGTFQVGGAYNAGSTSAVSMVAADFDGDGKLDLAVAGLFDDVVNLLLGNGDGSFQPPVGFDVGHLPRAIATGDFNHDGNVDLAVCLSESSLQVLLGDGHGAFRHAAHYKVGKAPDSVAVADFNGDGNLDLAVGIGLSGKGRVTILFGRGDGTFFSIGEFPSGDGTNAVAVADFNHDRAFDLATANFSANTVSILMNSGGTFVTAASSQNPAPVGQSVTFSAAVAPSLVSTVPTGTVSFGDGATILATVPLDQNGQGSFTTSDLGVGTHTIRTKYSGDPNFNPNTGKVITQIIQ